MGPSYCGQVERENGNLSMDQREFSINSEDYVSGYSGCSNDMA